MPQQTNEVFESVQEKNITQLNEELYEETQKNVSGEIVSPKTVHYCKNSFEKELYEFSIKYLRLFDIPFEEFCQRFLYPMQWESSYFKNSKNEFVLSVKMEAILKTLYRFAHFISSIEDDYCRLYNDYYYNKRKDCKDIKQEAYTQVFIYQTRFSTILEGDLRSAMKGIYSGSLTVHSFTSYISDYDNFKRLIEQTSGRGKEAEHDFVTIVELALFDARNILISYAILWKIVFGVSPVQPYKTGTPLPEDVTEEKEDIDEPNDNDETEEEAEDLEEADEDENILSEELPSEQPKDVKNKWPNKKVDVQFKFKKKPLAKKPIGESNIIPVQEVNSSANKLNVDETFKEMEKKDS